MASIKKIKFTYFTAQKIDCMLEQKLKVIVAINFYFTTFTKSI